ncbi:hypothetical protein H4O18_06225 [Arenibacter sp. BSSL-BM3]|uniref:Uncharacterized protein n=1 Tax=Arenibacter arenosicollis TaxID=2762274 RepID=A0ABR7QKK5_9FLAO|nr:hypothetical protein [Arenibacter arenosicollis]MBC8767584.1 hypothetical protein [Arenibacter arenosicollis]
MAKLIIRNIMHQTSVRPTRLKKTLQVQMAKLIIRNIMHQTSARPSRLKKKPCRSKGKINHPQYYASNLGNTYKVKKTVQVKLTT